MDIRIITTAAGADISFDITSTSSTGSTSSLFNNVYLSLAVIRGTWWFNPAFGMRDTRREKNTDKTARKVAVWVKEALQWLLDAGRATAVTVETERAPKEDPGRLKAHITVTAANGTPLTFTKFFEVV